MEWLMIIAFIAITILDSKKKSNQAKQNREQRKQMQGQQVHRSGNQTVQSKQIQAGGMKSAPKKQQTSRGNLLDSLTDWLEELETVEEKPVRETKKTVQQKVPVKPKGKKAEIHPVKKSADILPTKTLMETRPDREQREAHTKVAVSVAPLKNAFENQEACEHRIALNPNIQYSNQKQQADTLAVATVKTDKDSMIQGIIWSEILGKPKAYLPNVPKFRRR